MKTISFYKFITCDDIGMLVNSLIVVANEVFVSMVVDNQMLENKLTELTSLVRQLAIGQQ